MKFTLGSDRNWDPKGDFRPIFDR